MILVFALCLRDLMYVTCIQSHEPLSILDPNHRHRAAVKTCSYQEAPFDLQSAEVEILLDEWFLPSRAIQSQVVSIQHTLDNCHSRYLFHQTPAQGSDMLIYGPLQLCTTWFCLLRNVHIPGNEAF